MLLKLKAKHFKGTEYVINGNIEGGNPSCGCAIEKALWEILNVGEIDESVDTVFVLGNDYKHEEYGKCAFMLDTKMAESHNYDDTTIRTIEIIGLEEPVK